MQQRLRYKVHIFFFATLAGYLFIIILVADKSCRLSEVFYQRCSDTEHRADFPPLCRRRKEDKKEENERGEYIYT